MPFPRASYVIVLLAIVTLAGFWPSYFSSDEDVPLAFHVHGIAASAWILLVGFQVWSIQNGRRSLHRQTGLLSLALLPLFTASLVMIVNVSAAAYAEGGPYYSQLGPVFGYATLIPFLAYPLIFALALRNRRHINLHAGYMLATLFPLWEPGFVRVLIGFFPAMSINGPDDFHKVTDGIALSISIALAVAIYMYFTNRKYGTPFLIISVFLALQITGCYLVADTALWRAWFGAYAQIPSMLTVSAGLIFGAIAAWIGWCNPIKRSRVPVVE